jgi:hypothetical protein
MFLQEPAEKADPETLKNGTIAGFDQKDFAFRFPRVRSKKGRVIADPALSALKASFVSRHHPVR